MMPSRWSQQVDLAPLTRSRGSDSVTLAAISTRNAFTEPTSWVSARPRPRSLDPKAPANGPPSQAGSVLRYQSVATGGTAPGFVWFNAPTLSTMTWRRPWPAGDRRGPSKSRLPGCVPLSCGSRDDTADSHCQWHPHGCFERGGHHRMDKPEEHRADA
jgi:hypothetical protein